ncbi:MAG: hypothetical protein GY888_06330, partial [Planctomycetaceae bacterium]|nr:hypothetical protein [Planctomycetaceae bacterium]
MSFQTIRALIETRFSDAYGGLATPVPVVFDNVGGEPPGVEYVEVNISYVSTAEPVLCKEENSIEVLRGNLQVVVRTPRGNGMGRLESLDATAMTVMNNLKSWNLPDPDGVICTLGEVLGPVHLLAG